MTENISSVYEDVMIREWAQNIRQMMINELRAKVRKHEEDWTTFCKMTSGNFVKETEPDYLNTINKLKEKINILETK